MAADELDPSQGVPPGFSPALHPITVDDHGGYATIASGSGLVVVLLFALIRLFNIRRVGLHRSEYTLLTATAITIAQSTLVMLAVDEGLGRVQSLLRPPSKEKIEVMMYANNLLYILALFLSKLSLLSLVWRLSVERLHVVVSKWAFLFTFVAAVASVLLVALACDFKRPWEQEIDDCGSLLPRWIVVESLGILAVVRLFSCLQKGWRWKIKGLAIFGLRIGTIPLAIFRLTQLQAVGGSEHPIFEQVSTVTWTQSALAYSMATATIPALMGLIIMLNTNGGAFSPQTVMEQSQEWPKNFSSGQYELSNIQRSQDLAKGRSEDGADYICAVDAQGAGAEERSIASDDSKKMIIKKTVEFGSQMEEAPTGR